MPLCSVANQNNLRRLVGIPDKPFFFLCKTNEKISTHAKLSYQRTPSPHSPSHWRCGYPGKSLPDPARPLPQHHPARKFGLPRQQQFHLLHLLRPHGRLSRSEEHTSELQSRPHLVCRLLLEKKKKTSIHTVYYL